MLWAGHRDTFSEHNVEYFTALPGLCSNPGGLVLLRILEGDRPLAATLVHLPTLTALSRSHQGV